MKKEITDKQHRELLDLGYAGGNRIADLIEFLGDDLMDMSNELGNWWITHDDKLIHTEKLELVDALWAAVKYKLKNL